MASKIHIWKDISRNPPFQWVATTPAYKRRRRASQIFRSWDDAVDFVVQHIALVAKDR